MDGGRIGEGGEEGEGEGEGSRSGSTVVDLSQEGRYSVIREGRSGVGGATCTLHTCESRFKRTLFLSLGPDI